jgi:hypothetical protein
MSVIAADQSAEKFAPATMKSKCFPFIDRLKPQSKPAIAPSKRRIFKPYVSQQLAIRRGVACKAHGLGEGLAVMPRT